MRWSSGLNSCSLWRLPPDPLQKGLGCEPGLGRVDRKVHRMQMEKKVGRSSSCDCSAGCLTLWGKTVPGNYDPIFNIYNKLKKNL